jgi:hypothetical protein
VSGTSGSSGTSGATGNSGTSGTSGTSGATGGSGTSGSSGTSGASGTSGTSGVSGTSGTSGANGANGTSGTSGNSGTSGTSGNGTSGTSGTSPSGGITGSLTSGYIPYASSATSLADSPLYWDGGLQELYTYFGGNAIGLDINFNSNVYSLGDYNSLINHTYIIVDDNAQSIRFNTNNFTFSGALTNGASWSFANRYLEVTINGVGYNIPLYN